MSIIDAMTMALPRDKLKLNYLWLYLVAGFRLANRRVKVPPPSPPPTPSECFQLFVAQNFRVFVTMLAKSIQRHTLRKSRTSGVLSGSTMTSSTVWMRYGCHCGSVRWPTTLTPVLSLMLLLVSVETLSLATVTTATRMHYIHWNTTNPM